MAPKPRKTDKHLPPRVYSKNGAYYYVTVKNKWIWLGRTFPAAMAAWTKLMNCNDRLSTMNQLFDRYMLEIAPAKSPKSYKDNIAQICKLRTFFGEMSPIDVTPVDIYEYMDLRSQKAPVSANREKALLSHCFSMAIRWGIVGDNPCRNVKRTPEKPRQRYVEDWEYKVVYDAAPALIKLFMTFAYLTGQRIGDILSIRLSDLTTDGIKIEQNKTGAKLIISWSDELRACVTDVKGSNASIRGLYLFCNKKGQPVTYDGFSTAWQKNMKKVVAQGLIKESFTFHDLRAKSNSDADNRQNASDLLGHADIKITDRVYNRKHKKVNPLR